MTNDLKISGSNSIALIQQRAKAELIDFRFLLFVVFARPILLFSAHLITAGIFAILGDETPFRTAGPYWSVYGTLTDIGCLLLLYFGVRKEGIRLVDLISFERKRLLKDIFVGIGIGVAGGLIMILLSGKIASIIAYGNLTPVFPEGSYIRQLPLWAVLYGRLVWWIIWSPTEELIYNGYSLPRLQAVLSGKWKALLLVSFSWSIMHCFLPFINIQHAIYMFIMFFPLMLFLGLMYMHFKRLTPLIVGHWLMDISNVFLMTTVL